MPTLESQLSVQDLPVPSPGASQQDTNDANNNAITLTFNGVDFRLVPNVSARNDCSSSSISMTNTNGKFTSIQLESFTGSLIVSASALTSLLPSSSSNANPTTNPVTTKSTKDHSHQSSQATNTVEDESSEPEGEPEPKSRSRSRSHSPPPSQVSRRGGNGNSSKKGIKLPNGQKQLSFLKHNNQSKKKDQEKGINRNNNKRGNVSSSPAAVSSTLKVCMA